MGKLIPYLLKLASIVLVINLLSYFVMGITLSLDFLFKIHKINIVNFILVVAVILKLQVNLSSFLNFKVVEQSGWIKTFIVISFMDFLILIVPLVIATSSFLTEFLKNDKIFIQVKQNIKGIYNSDYSSLNPFQITVFKSLFLYMIIALSIIIYFVSKYKKHLKSN